jgi:2-methylisocitrate lyase-like PEP mutase family enzyme
MSLAKKAEQLLRLHDGPEPLLLANAWDAATAVLVESSGFPAVATTSGGVAQALGFEDGEKTPAEQMLAAVGRMAAAVDLPVTADLERGYGLSPEELVAGMLDAGIVGLNYEDTDHAAGGKTLVDAAEQAEALAAIRAAADAAGVHLVINARVDTFVRGVDDALEEALRRGRLYLDAGADCVYPIFLKDEAAIGRMVEELDAPVNALLIPDAPPLPRLRELGVRRISVGSGLMIAAMRSHEQRLERLRSGEPYWA